MGNARSAFDVFKRNTTCKGLKMNCKTIKIASQQSITGIKNLNKLGKGEVPFRDRALSFFVEGSLFEL